MYLWLKYFIKPLSVVEAKKDVAQLVLYVLPDRRGLCLFVHENFLKLKAVFSSAGLLVAEMVFGRHLLEFFRQIQNMIVDVEFQTPRQAYTGYHYFLKKVNQVFPIICGTKSDSKITFYCFCLLLQCYTPLDSFFSNLVFSYNWRVDLVKAHFVDP